MIMSVVYSKQKGKWVIMVPKREGKEGNNGPKRGKWVIMVPKGRERKEITAPKRKRKGK